MKQASLAMLLLAVTELSFCQQIKQERTMLNTSALMNKGAKQKKAAWITLAGGATLLVTGLIIPKGDRTGFSIIPYGDTYENDDIKAAFGLTGVAAMLGSIPLFVASERNQKKARTATISIRNQRINIMRQDAGAGIRQQAVAVCIAL